METVRIEELPLRWRANALALACAAMGNRNEGQAMRVREAVSAVQAVINQRADELSHELMVLETNLRVNTPIKIRNGIAEHLGTDERFITTTAGVNIDLDELAQAIYRRIVGSAY